MVMLSPQARMLYTYKLPDGVLRLSDKAEYFADASEAYHDIARVMLPVCLSCTVSGVAGRFSPRTFLYTFPCPSGALQFLHCLSSEPVMRSP